LAAGAPNPLAGIKAELVELRATVVIGDAEEMTFTVRGATIAYYAKTQEMVVNGVRSRAPLKSRKLSLTVYCDRTGLEVFASDGLVFVPMPFLPKSDDLALGVRVLGGSVRFESLKVYELKSAW
jgi:sucrose-6-phosphate hydrolase SacC (GH32 family)